MSDERALSTPIDLETLLPWSLNGTLTELEQARVREAFEQGLVSQQSLDQVLGAYELAIGRPDSATLVALAAGDLSADEREAVERYLRSPEGAGDRELVQLALVAMSAEEEPLRQLPSPQRAASPLFWRTWAVAASLLAVVMAALWWAAVRKPGPGPAMAVVEVAELLPDDMVLRGADHDAPSVEVGAVGVTFVLIVEKQVENRLLSVSLRDEADREIARIDPVRLQADGSLHVFIAAEMAGTARRLVLQGRTAEADSPIPIHEYSFQPSP